ncbi:integration host factor subunit beta [Verminephrobacter aporrectodeae]|uniref:integration host factor subunit beta n=1 Tax=Verminephrobacter aporrectodeae TaxID=1110389 RepID=UPI00023784C4|nr:integration host factor subunit beta [Verminephrobacter aporrectodeae]
MPIKPIPQDSMTRSDLVEELAARFSQLTPHDAEYAVKTILDAMGAALVRGHRIEIRGFGSFSINHRPPRMGRNPRSGEAVAIPEKRVPHFRPGKALREAMDERTAEMQESTSVVPPGSGEAQLPAPRPE